MNKVFFDMMGSPAFRHLRQMYQLSSLKKKSFQSHPFVSVTGVPFNHFDPPKSETNDIRIRWCNTELAHHFHNLALMMKLVCDRVSKNCKWCKLYVHFS